MAIGTGVARWRFIIRALRCLMFKPTAEMTFTAKSCSGVKLHWCIIIMQVGYMNGNGYRAFTIALFVNNTGLGKSRTDWLSHLHSCLQIDGLLHTNPSLDIALHPIEKPKHHFCLIHFNTLHIPFRKSNKIFSYSSLLGPLGQRLLHIIGAVGWLKVPK